MNERQEPQRAAAESASYLAYLETQISRIRTRLAHVPVFRFTDETTQRSYEIYPSGYVNGLEGGQVTNLLTQMQMDAFKMGELTAELRRLRLLSECGHSRPLEPHTA